MQDPSCLPIVYSNDWLLFTQPQMTHSIYHLDQRPYHSIFQYTYTIFACWFQETIRRPVPLNPDGRLCDLLYYSNLPYVTYYVISLQNDLNVNYTVEAMSSWRIQSFLSFCKWLKRESLWQLQVTGSLTSIYIRSDSKKLGKHFKNILRYV